MPELWPGSSHQSQPFDHAPHTNFVMAVEKAYLDAIVGIRPASLGLNGLSGRTFREIVEYFALLFSSRPTGQSRHIPARYFVDLRIVFRYFYTPAIAEAQLEFFSWKWRYAVMYCVATAIRGLPGQFGATLSPQKSEYSESFRFEISSTPVSRRDNDSRSSKLLAFGLRQCSFGFGLPSNSSRAERGTRQIAYGLSANRSLQLDCHSQAPV
jgi:hypothetical protein